MAMIGAATAMLLVVGVTATLRPSAAPRPAERTPTPSPTKLDEGFPEYADGARVVAAKAVALPTRSVTITFVPTTVDLVFLERCVGLPDEVHLDLAITLNGRSFVSGTCGTTVLRSDLSEYRLAVGKPATVTATVRGATRFSSETGRQTNVGVPAAGTVAFAVGERIPFSDYPLPPRPATLRPMNDDSVPPGAVVVRADPADPALPKRLTATWRAVENIEMASQTPGLLHVRINGVEVATGEWWDYGQRRFSSSPGTSWPSEFGLTVRPGERVTIEVIPTYVTGDWRVVFVPRG